MNRMTDPLKHQFPHRRDTSRRRCGFTLVELLVVILLILLIIALAVPAFNMITGSRSVEAAQNMIAAMLGRARAEAISRQKKIGVFFFVDPATDRSAIALVTAASSDL